jgi:hypothetical protein
MAGPAITLTATLQNASGAVDTGAKMRVTLAGFGGIVPKVNNVSMLSMIRQTLLQPAGGPISLLLYGNDVITPGPSITFYCIEIFDSKGNIVQSGNYQIAGSGSVDLSTLNQYFPPPPPTVGENPVLLNPPGSALQTINGSITIVGNLIVTGTINASTTLFTVASSASPLFDGDDGNAFRMILTSDTVQQAVVHMANKLILPISLIQDGTGGHAFTWGSNVFGGGFVNPGANERSTQLFFVEGDGSLYAAGPIMYFP